MAGLPRTPTVLRRGRFDGHVMRGGLSIRQASHVTPTIRTKYDYKTHVHVKGPGRKKSRVEY